MCSRPLASAKNNQLGCKDSKSRTAMNSSKLRLLPGMVLMLSYLSTKKKASSSGTKAERRGTSLLPLIAVQGSK